MPKAKDVTSTQLGAIGENIVATQIILESNGRLSPFQPIADDMGIDMLVYDKFTGLALPLQIKIRTKTLKRFPKIVHFEIRKSTFNEKQNAFILAVLFDADIREVKIKRAWLIPMVKLHQIAMERAEKFMIRPSIDMNAKDKYSAYRCENPKEVTERLINHIVETG